MGKGTVIEIAQPEVSQPEVSQCRHHWLIESPHGAVSQGRCKRCGARREFRNSAPDAMWEDDSSSDLGRWGRSAPVTIRTDDEEMATAGRSGTSERGLVL